MCVEMGDAHIASLHLSPCSERLHAFAFKGFVAVPQFPSVVVHAESLA